MLKTTLSADASIGFVTSAIETNLALITASAPALRPLLRAWFPKLFRVDRDEVVGNTERRVLGTAATRMTRLKSQTQLQSQTRESEEEAIMEFSGIVRNTDIVIRYTPGLDIRAAIAQNKTDLPILGTQQSEKWI
jgi:hypothetical protein